MGGAKLKELCNSREDVVNLVTKLRVVYHFEGNSANGDLNLGPLGPEQARYQSELLAVRDVLHDVSGPCPM